MVDIPLMPQQNLSYMSWTVKNTAFFKSQYKLLPRHIQESAKGVLEIMMENPYDESLMTHSLRKPLSNYHGISVNDIVVIINLKQNKKWTKKAVYKKFFIFHLLK
jgi:mRNA-degrading endonuclease RelE of RelBE toxin-antitoxin system